MWHVTLHLPPPTNRQSPRLPHPATDCIWRIGEWRCPNSWRCKYKYQFAWQSEKDPVLAPESGVWGCGSDGFPGPAPISSPHICDNLSQRSPVGIRHPQLVRGEESLIGQQQLPEPEPEPESEDRALVSAAEVIVIPVSPWPPSWSQQRQPKSSKVMLSGHSRSKYIHE